MRNSTPPRREKGSSRPGRYTARANPAIIVMAAIIDEDGELHRAELRGQEEEHQQSVEDEREKGHRRDGMARLRPEGQDVEDLGGEEGDQAGREPFLGNSGRCPQERKAQPGQHERLVAAGTGAAATAGPRR